MTWKHTPGPWVLTGSADIAVGTTEQESAVAVCVCQGTRTVGEAQANARMIAAAPDLLEALKDAEQWVADYVVQMHSYTVSDYAIATLAKIVQTIAKAEGRV